MEPSEGTPSHNVGETAPAWGELVVQNGRLSGTTRSLHAPLILMGQAEGCDIRLNAQGISPIHCVLLQTSAGAVLRDLQGKGGASLNSKPIALQTAVQSGDLLAVGPFRFRINLTATPESPASEKKETCQGEREALRIQAAAVAAQQAALIEEEIRLQQRRSALEQQETQLAAHLEDKRRKLIELRQQTRDTQEQFKKEQADHAQRVTETQQQLEAARVDIADSKQQALTERRRLFRLRQRLKQRLHRHWVAERRVMRRREDELLGKRRDIELEAEQLREERAQLDQDRLRFNGEVELGKRRLEDAWTQFRREQQQWEELRSREQAELTERTSGLDQRDIILIDAERDLAEEKQRWQQARLHLEKETEGLDLRVRNQRRKLLELEQEAQRIAATTGGVPASATPPAEKPGGTIETDALAARARQLKDSELEVQRRLSTLEKLSGELSDQRLYLAEQCVRLLEARKRWQQERDMAAAALEPLALRLHEREQTTLAREQAVGAIEADLRQRQDEVAHLRQHLDAWQARLAVRAAAWEGERDRLLAELRSREELAARQLAAVANLRQRWQQRRHHEVERIQALLSVCEQFRQECISLRDDWLRRCAAMEQERRGLADRSLALEEFQRQGLAKALDAAEAEQRLEQLRQRWSAEFVDAAQPLVRECHELETQSRRLEEQFARLHQDAVRAVALEAEHFERQTESDHAQLLAETQYAKLRQELQCLHDQAEVYEGQMRELNEEVEHLARALIDESLPVTMPMTKAA